MRRTGASVASACLHHLWKRVKQLAREIDRIAAKKGPNYVPGMKEPYRELLQNAQSITQRARELCVTLTLPNASAADIVGPHTWQAFIARTERVMDTAARRILNDESHASISHNRQHGWR